jgi:hypothetical protein
LLLLLLLLLVGWPSCCLHIGSPAQQLPPATVLARR